MSMEPPPIHINSQIGDIHANGALEIRYKRLKKKYYNLEAKLQQTELWLQRATEQNIRLKGERDKLLDRVISLEDSASGTLQTNTSLIDEPNLEIAFLAPVHLGQRKSSKRDIRQPWFTTSFGGKHSGLKVDAHSSELSAVSRTNSGTSGQTPSYCFESTQIFPPPQRDSRKESAVVSNEFLGPRGPSPSCSASSLNSLSSTPSHDKAMQLMKPQSLAPSASLRRGADPTSSSIQRATKPKRLKSSTVKSKSFSIPVIPRDPATGRPYLPLTVGIITVINLGQILSNRHYHTERYIFPVGYEVSRRYLSTKDPTADTTYTCKILSNGDSPLFQISASDLDAPIIAGTATGAWSGIIRAANLIRNRAHSNSVSGPEYFGLGQNTIKCLIQELDGARELEDYVWQNYIEGGPLAGRHAPVMHTTQLHSTSTSPASTQPNHLPPPPPNHFYAPDGTLIPLPPFPGPPPGIGMPPMLNPEFDPSASRNYSYLPTPDQVGYSLAYPSASQYHPGTNPSPLHEMTSMAESSNTSKPNAEDSDDEENEE